MQLLYDLEEEDLERGARPEIIQNALTAFSVENRQGELVLPVRCNRPPRLALALTTHDNIFLSNVGSSSQPTATTSCGGSLPQVGRKQQRQQRRVCDTVIGYMRASTDDQTLGPNAQRAALETWCAARSAVLVGVFTDQGVGGGASLDQRPGLLAALAALKEHNASVLLVAKRDRLACDVLVAAMVERLAERNGARVQRQTEQQRVTDPKRCSENNLTQRRRDAEGSQSSTHLLQPCDSTGSA